MWQIPMKETTELQITEMDLLRRLRGISGIYEVRNLKIREIMRVQNKPNVLRSVENK
jgi:hypothetical protein